jgi:hypothetical protein
VLPELAAQGIPEMMKEVYTLKPFLPMNFQLLLKEWRPAIIVLSFSTSTQ